MIRLLFVCEHGAVKSVIAATLFNRLARERGVAGHAVSRGTDPDPEIPQLVRDGLRAEGIDIGDVRPIPLGSEDTRRANLVITFDLELPPELADSVTVLRWDGIPPVMSAYESGRDAIASRVADLFAGLDSALQATSHELP